MDWTHTAGAGNMRKLYEFLVGKPEGKRSLARPGHKRENNIKN